MTTVEGISEPESGLPALEGIERAPSAPLLEGPVGVILAAGSGSRLGGLPKPLARVAGLTLLERTVATFRSSGLERIIVVVGHGSASVCEFVAGRGLDVELVENGDFQLGNGSSVLVGGRAAAGRFLVGMVDHVVEREAVTRLLASRAPFALAVDSQPRYCDVEEATKVRLAGGRVVAVTRELDEYDAVDAGLAVCDLVVVASAERSLLAGETTWNAVKRRWLAEGGEIEAVDLEGLFWIDVDTPGDLRRAERLVLASAARKAADGPVARLLNRRLSWRLSLLLVRARVSPDAATLLAFLLALLAAGALAAGHEWSAALLAGGVLTQIASIVDGVDGEIARASLRASPAGAFLDSVLDRVADAALLAGLALAAGPNTATWAALTAALFGSLLVPYVRASYEACFGRPFPPSGARLGAGRDVRLLVVALAALALQPFWGLVAVAFLANLEVAHRVMRARPVRAQ
jgi:1L-myo-inositol 1-phosphate cytidylyltransferase / CDP-L-myo-inositol myo-inositolphosphotransferase